MADILDVQMFAADVVPRFIVRVVYIGKIGQASEYVHRLYSLEDNVFNCLHRRLLHSASYIRFDVGLRAYLYHQLKPQQVSIPPSVERAFGHGRFHGFYRLDVPKGLIREETPCLATVISVQSRSKTLIKIFNNIEPPVFRHLKGAD